MAPSPRGHTFTPEDRYHNEFRDGEGTADRPSNTMPKSRESQQRRHDGLALGRDKSSICGNRRTDRDSIESRADLGTHVPHPFTPFDISQTRSHDGKHREYYHENDPDDIPSYARSPTVPKAQRSGQQRLRSSLAGPDVCAEPSTSSKTQPSSTTLDFKKTRLSPRKYMHRKGGESGLSKLSSTANSVANSQTDLMSQTDCASALTKAVRQRYGKESWHKGDRNFDYGLD
ncbi:hypothetical protein F4824DRAFT_506469 [Ustulina deusta]|nr:hypothetical protein F4824DRAFT_506469 [Ustulina deusta]